MSHHPLQQSPTSTNKDKSPPDTRHYQLHHHDHRDDHVKNKRENDIRKMLLTDYNIC
ncbi:MAG TPA: hypothetical protein VLG50_06555 [Candidatus Saccharimonadales bacterium]|nr:hypothetical protein [Candidatus Saccharimonadales bacterium]